jgi:hypothetical protein
MRGYSITSSPGAIRLSETVNPRASAVFRLCMAEIACSRITGAAEGDSADIALLARQAFRARHHPARIEASIGSPPAELVSDARKGEAKSI